MIVKHLGMQDYQATWDAMRAFTQTRTEDTADELWLLEHPPVFTFGQAGKKEHLLHPHDIPVIQTDRGGQVTYHGPGQLIAYVLFDLRRGACSIRELVTRLESMVITILAKYGVVGYTDHQRPGVYVQDRKIASVGLRVKRGCSYHGLSFNINMDLTPFSYINPCGYRGLCMTQLSAFAPQVSIQEVSIYLSNICSFLMYS